MGLFRGLARWPLIEYTAKCHPDSFMLLLHRSLLAWVYLIMKPGAVLEVLRARQQMGGDVRNSALKLQQFWRLMKEQLERLETHLSIAGFNFGSWSCHVLLLNLLRCATCGLPLL